MNSDAGIFCRILGLQCGKSTNMVLYLELAGDKICITTSFLMPASVIALPTNRPHAFTSSRLVIIALKDFTHNASLIIRPSPDAKGAL